MPEFEEATLQVTYKGVEITGQVLEKLFTSILREIEKTWAQETEKNKAKSIAKGNTKPLGKEVHTPDTARAAKDLRGEGVLFQVLKQPGEAPEYTLVFKGKDMATIEKALKSLTDDRTIEKTPERSELGPQQRGTPGREKGKPRIFTGKDLQDDIRIAREAVTKRNAERAATRAPKAPERGLDR